MEQDWVKIYTATDTFRAEMVRQVLECNQIDAVVINKQNTPYGFGDVLVYIHQDNFQEALEIIIQSEL